MAAVALTLLQTGDPSRELYLFDRFEGMTSATEKDFDYTGKSAAQLLRDLPGDRCDDAPLDRVKDILYATSYPRKQIHFIKGPVEQTVPASAPTPIALLRVDTNWYESAMHELVHLYPHLSRAGAGVLIVDDYGH